jgi:uncharacterized membrane protein YwzB
LAKVSIRKTLRIYWSLKSTSIVKFVKKSNITKL